MEMKCWGHGHNKVLEKVIMVEIGRAGIVSILKAENLPGIRLPTQSNNSLGEAEELRREMCDRDVDVAKMASGSRVVEQD